MMPIAPNNPNAPRHDIHENTHKTSSGVNAPPQRAPNHITPTARLRSVPGSQFLNIFARIGKQPASPAPKRNRVTNNERRLHAPPLAGVKHDPQTTTLITSFR